MICAKDEALAYRLLRHGITGITPGDARILRLAQLTLRKWAEEECNGEIQREESTGICFRHYGRGTKGPFQTVRIADRETQALASVAKVAERLSLHVYHQRDPRGCSLYVSHKPLTAQRYTDGVACIVG